MDLGQVLPYHGKLSADLFDVTISLNNIRQRAVENRYAAQPTAWRRLWPGKIVIGLVIYDPELPA